MQLGIDRLISEPEWQRRLSGKRVAIAGHPASISHTGIHSLDALKSTISINITAAFGPQHGMRGDKQDNMIESPEFIDPIHGIPIFSLYGEVRRPTDRMMDTFDVLLFDIQDIGCRIYTYITTLLYLLEACSTHGKSIWILDRPNPAGRTVEGLLLQPDWESFVGASDIIMRHGLTIGEIAQWFVRRYRLDIDLTIVKMTGYTLHESPGYGWPSDILPWVNPSPNASSVNMARAFPGTVLIEGTHLSEGRGTTIALEIVGAPDIESRRILNTMTTLAPEWMDGCIIRPCYFEPTFHKHAGKLCQGFQIHTDFAGYNPTRFRPFRLIILFLKALRQIHPNYDIWRKHAYEYEHDRLPIDLINGGPALREWVDDSHQSITDMERRLLADEKAWTDSIQDVLLY